MGTSKALLDWRGQPLIVAHCLAMASAGGRVVVVLGCDSKRIEPLLPDGAEVRVNPNWRHTDMAASLRIGLGAIVGRVLITPVDVPPTPNDVLHTLLQADAPAVLAYQGQPGHPVMVDAETTLLGLTEGPLNTAIAGARRVETPWAGAIRTWNTPAEWADQSPA